MEDCCDVQKDTASVKPHRKFPVALPMVVLALIMISGAYVCSISLQLSGFLRIPHLQKVKMSLQPCNRPNLTQSEFSYLHFPEPKTYNREECECNPVRYFAILSMQRSGSGWFETLLNSHENVSSNGEIFSVKERRKDMTSIRKTLDKVYNLDWFSSASRNECTAAVGLKWMLNQGLMQYHEEITEYFNREGVFVIFLLRRNLLRRLVSILSNTHDRDTKQLNGTHKAHVHSRNEADVLARYKPSMNTTLLIPELKRTDKMAADGLAFFKSTNHIVVYYEDVVKNRTKLVDVLEFMKLPKRELSSRQIKIHTRPLSDQIDNWDDVYKALHGTKYKNFLNADYRR